MNEAATRRLFIALDLPATLARDIEELTLLSQPLLPSRVPGAMARMIRVEVMHVTVKFLGNVESTRIDALKRIVRDVATRHAPIVVSSAKLTGFPSQNRAHVFVLELDDPTKALRQLAEDVRALLITNGFEPESRPFRPHVTMARLREGADVRRAAVDRVALSTEARFDELVLYDSLSHGAVTGPTYVSLERAPLSLA